MVRPIENLKLFLLCVPLRKKSHWFQPILSVRWHVGGWVGAGRCEGRAGRARMCWAGWICWVGYHAPCAMGWLTLCCGENPYVNIIFHGESIRLPGGPATRLSAAARLAVGWWKSEKMWGEKMKKITFESEKIFTGVLSGWNNEKVKKWETQKWMFFSSETLTKIFTVQIATCFCTVIFLGNVSKLKIFTVQKNTW